MQLKYFVGMILAGFCSIAQADGNYLTNLVNSLNNIIGPVHSGASNNSSSNGTTEGNPPIDGGGVGGGSNNQVDLHGALSLRPSSRTLSDTCDIDYLYLSKANITPSSAVLDNCAIKEWNLVRDQKHDARNVMDPFLRRDIISEYRPVTLQRLAEISNAKRFYSVNYSITIGGYDTTKNGFLVTIHFLGGSEKINGELTYFTGNGFDTTSDWKIWLKPSNETDAHRLEDAIMHNRVGSDQDFVGFVVTGTHYQPDTIEYHHDFTPGKDQIIVSIKQLVLHYTTANGDNYTTGFDLY